MSSESPTHRRDFVRALAIGGAAASIPSPTRADEKEKGKPTDEPVKARSEVDARMDLILARYGTSLDEAARKSVRAEVESIVRRSESLRKFPLANGDEPFPVFTPYRAPLA